MALSDWLIAGGFVWLLKRAFTNSQEQREAEAQRIEAENRRIEAAARHAEEKYRKAQAEKVRKSAVNEKRKETPCFFQDGISYDEFCRLANSVAKNISRITKISINRDATIFCTVKSITGYSDWDFMVDFNDWGHITGTRWTWSENTDSNIPNHFGCELTSSICRSLSSKNIYLRSFASAVDSNTALETKSGFEFHKRRNVISRILFHEKTIVSQYDSSYLKGNHLYPVISFLKDNGFCDIKSRPAKDIGQNSTNFLFEVEQIVIDGSSFFEEGDVFHENSEVIIVYHDRQEIVMPYPESHFKRRNYTDVVAELHSLGFSNLRTHEIEDLTVGLIKKDGSVKRISVLSNKLQKNAIYKFDDEFVIEYHTFR